MGSADCAKEILNKYGSIKHMVEEVLCKCGGYILFTTHELNNEQKKERIRLTRERLTNLGKKYATTAIIDIYDA